MVLLLFILSISSSSSSLLLLSLLLLYAGLLTTGGFEQILKLSSLIVQVFFCPFCLADVGMKGSENVQVNIIIMETFTYFMQASLKTETLGIKRSQGPNGAQYKTVIYVLG